MRGAPRLRSHGRIVDNVPCQKSAMDETLNMTPKLKRPSKSELINGVEQAPQRWEGWRAKDEGDTSERRERMRFRHLHRFLHSRSRQMTARMLGGLCNMVLDVIGAREVP